MQVLRQKVKSRRYVITLTYGVEIDLDSSFDPLYDALYARFTTAEAYSIFPDVLDTLDQLKKLGYQMGVISNSDERVGKVVEC